MNVSQVKDQGSDVEDDQNTKNDPAGQGYPEESENEESDVENTDEENEEDEDKVTQQELYLLLISFFAILGLTHCAMAWYSSLRHSTIKRIILTDNSMFTLWAFLATWENLPVSKTAEIVLNLFERNLIKINTILVSYSIVCLFGTANL